MKFGGGVLLHPAESESAPNLSGVVRPQLYSMKTAGFAASATFLRPIVANPSKPAKDNRIGFDPRINAFPMHCKPEKLDMFVRPVQPRVRVPSMTLTDWSGSWKNRGSSSACQLADSEMNTSPSTLVRFWRNGAAEIRPVVLVIMARLPFIWVMELRPIWSKYSPIFTRGTCPCGAVPTKFKLKLPM